MTLDAPVDYIDRHGAPALTMRKLGAELGVEAMALYRYVPGREDLLEAVIARTLEGLHDRLDGQLTRTWQLRSIELVEDFLRTLSDHGFNDRHVAETYRSFTSVLLGHLLLECGPRGAHAGPIEEPLDAGSAGVPHQDGRGGLQDAPTVRRLRPLLSEDHAENEFDVAVEARLNRIQMLIS